MPAQHGKRGQRQQLGQPKGVEKNKGLMETEKRKQDKAQANPIGKTKHQHNGQRGNGRCRQQHG